MQLHQSLQVTKPENLHLKTSSGQAILMFVETTSAAFFLPLKFVKIPQLPEAHHFFPTKTLALQAVSTGIFETLQR